ncbi:hypothetical protein ABZ726_10495 [Streptomyces hundungensis]
MQHDRIPLDADVPGGGRRDGGFERAGMSASETRKALAGFSRWSPSR